MLGSQIISIGLSLHSGHHMQLSHVRGPRLGVDKRWAAGGHGWGALKMWLASTLITSLHATSVVRWAERLVRREGHGLLVRRVVTSPTTGSALIASTVGARREAGTTNVTVDGL